MRRINNMMVVITRIKLVTSLLPLKLKITLVVMVARFCGAMLVQKGAGPAPLLNEAATFFLFREQEERQSSRAAQLWLPELPNAHTQAPRRASHKLARETVCSRQQLDDVCLLAPKWSLGDDDGNESARRRLRMFDFSKTPKLCCGSDGGGGFHWRRCDWLRRPWRLIDEFWNVTSKLLQESSFKIVGVMRAAWGDVCSWSHQGAHRQGFDWFWRHLFAPRTHGNRKQRSAPVAFGGLRGGTLATTS